MQVHFNYLPLAILAAFLGGLIGQVVSLRYRERRFLRGYAEAFGIKLRWWHRTSVLRRYICDLIGRRPVFSTDFLKLKALDATPWCCRVDVFDWRDGRIDVIVNWMPPWAASKLVAALDAISPPEVDVRVDMQPWWRSI